ncbi:ParB N-terminal domain-containing protein [Staphylococcus aureus]|jgi:ParB-like chromosome segregation protein Spo0J|uniref:ParB N-terminal domain-containing protein n=1 Tax=Staphylococcus aureus TaxID=1280 RepID=UPI0004656280|nr:ParB N-terminal domain-containing protein [Staphylococcus aureus]MBB2528412.1 ParB N-terminal domain-containing protein [Staphylococcus aureus]MBC2930987.1 ParB N-terminal domain-containing protein [Staphylococcus aureus]MBC2946205.1 ParB N-terminal domain-containing protein [Staphylococcus aureus]MBC2948661.1 ParB N-terminal domain-containing protein [Staphylococcus aureus]MBC2953573.1 ParB N-terminal domain-containing protein [Staphylococcus aureus]
MLIDINKVTVGKRIRKDYGDITSLADDIEDRGLINPPVVTPDYELIAGERRLKAMKKLDYRQIEVRIMSVEDYEHQLKIEISENEERKAFTYSERMDYAKQLERIEAKKAKDRKTSKLKQNKDTVTDQGPERKGETRDIVGKASGFGSGRTYARAKYIYENADEETIKEVDEGKKSIRKAHDELRAKEKQNEANKVKVTTKEKPQTTVVDRRERMNAEVEAMSETETNLALSEAAAANIVNVCSNLLYAVNNIEDLELTLNFLKSRDAEELSKVLKASKALNKIIEKGDFINV